MEEIVKNLALQPHPEGGFYRETFRSKHRVKTSDDRERQAFSSILYCIASSTKSSVHRVNADELWNFHTGDPVTICVSKQDGTMEKMLLGDPSVTQGASWQHLVDARDWFASSVQSQHVKIGYSLVGCTVTPGFQFEDFEMLDREGVRSEIPTEHQALFNEHFAE